MLGYTAGFAIGAPFGGAPGFITGMAGAWVGEWASKILGHNDEKEKEYIQSVIKADFEEAGDQDVFRKIKADLKDHNISEEEIRKKMNELNEKAKSEFK